MKRIYLHKARDQIARPNTIRDINRQIVLNYVRDCSPISRADIARATNLQRSTVSSIVDALENDGLIEEIGTGNSTGGRKPMLLRIKTGDPAAIGVDMTPRSSTVAVADLSGRVIEKDTFPTSSDADTMSLRIVERLTVLAERYSGADLDVGISLPGVADQRSGKVLYVPCFKWRDWDICNQIVDNTGLKVTIDNDANAIALAELWFGRETIRNVADFITVLIGEGVGTGIVFDGQVYRGEKGDAGEFGHMTVGGTAPVKCSCGGRDCWEAHASEGAVIARYKDLAEKDGVSKSAQFRQVIELANRGNVRAEQAFRQTASYIGIGISNLIVGLSPQAVVVSGAIIEAWDLIADEVHSVVERSIRRRLPKTVITTSTLGPEPTLTGAITLVLARKFSSAS